MGHIILLAMSEFAERHGLETYLSQLGYDVAVAETVRGAIDAALARRFDLLIVSVTSQEFNGDFLDRLRAVQSHVDVLVLSAASDQTGVRECLRFSLPPDHILVEPIEPAQVMKRVIGILGPPSPGSRS